jgi:hypothetical protein
MSWYNSIYLKNDKNSKRLFYDQGNLAALYRENGKYTDFLVWPDNLSFLYFKTVINRIMQEQHKNTLAYTKNKS